MGEVPVCRMCMVQIQRLVDTIALGCINIRPFMRGFYRWLALPLTSDSHQNRQQLGIGCILHCRFESNLNCSLKSNDTSSKQARYARPYLASEAVTKRYLHKTSTPEEETAGLCAWQNLSVSGVCTEVFSLRCLPAATSADLPQPRHCLPLRKQHARGCRLRPSICGSSPCPLRCRSPLQKVRPAV